MGVEIGKAYGANKICWCDFFFLILASDNRDLFGAIFWQPTTFDVAPITPYIDKELPYKY